ncbi:MAG TPA: hypothetical protein VFQ61_05290 [Polyangiaceae bacterium]|nr:hypothetical protein [Polyangiaceae bacterium]
MTTSHSGKLERRRCSGRTPGTYANPHHHRITDRPDTLDYEFMAQVANMVRVAVSNPTPADIERKLRFL